jgi:hypothetical protein
MVFNSVHSLEIHYLKRRIKYLEELDRLYEENPIEPDILNVKVQFEKVQTPSALIQTIQEIYGEDFQ